MTAVAQLELFAGLLDFTSQCYPNEIANIDSVLGSAVVAVEGVLAKATCALLLSCYIVDVVVDAMLRCA